MSATRMKIRIINMLRSNGLKRYNILRHLGGYRVLWAGDHRICLVKQ